MLHCGKIAEVMQLHAWLKCGAQKQGRGVKLCSISPTSEAFTENVHRCHFQVAIWKAALLESPPEMDSTKYDRELDHLGILLLRTVPSGTWSAPPNILQFIHCDGNASGCRTAACSCTKMGWTIFCLCEGVEA